MTPYDVGSVPPAPLARASLRTPDGRKAVTDVVMLMDTGADLSLVPSAVVDFLGLTAEAIAVPLEGFDGTRSVAHPVQLDLILGQRVFRGLYLVTSQPRGILGRDVLNHLEILLDGPRLQWEFR